MRLSSALLALTASALREPAALRAGAPLNIEGVLDGKNLTAVVVDSKNLSNDTIQVVFEANFTRVPIEDKTKVRIVYSAEDGESKSLIRDAVASLFTRDALLKKTSLELIPYGGATEIQVASLSTGFLYWHPELQNGNISHVYRCPNGESECESSLIHACAMEVAEHNPLTFLPFIGCMMAAKTGTSPEDASFNCATSTSFMEKLRACALGPQGVSLQHRLATTAAQIKPIPAIYIDGQLRALNVSSTVGADLQKIVCDTLFAQGRLDRDTCEGKGPTAVVAPFESLLTQPGKSVKQ